MFPRILVRSYSYMIAVIFIAISILPGLIVPAEAAQQEESKSQDRHISINPGPDPTVLKGTLRPYSKHIYRFHARAGQEMTIRLLPQKQEAESKRDIVFWVQSRGWYPSGSRTALLEGIDKGGVTYWSGSLPGTGEYEIYISNPPISDHVIRNSLPYKLEITAK
jgi:hypothetical protein